MIAKREIWKYQKEGKVWVGKYRNSHNLIHWHPECELLYVEKGAIDVFCDGGKYSLAENQSLFVGSEQLHYMHARTPNTVLIVIIFDYEIIRPYFEKITLLCPQLEQRYPVPALYLQLRAILTKKDAFFGAEAAKETLGFMLDVFRKEPITAAKTSSIHPLQRLLEEINNRCGDYSFDEAAVFMNMSSAYFCRYFKKNTGIHFLQYLNYIRTDNAVKMLRSGEKKSMTQIASDCGFSTIRTFNRVFRELTGYTPTHLPPDFVLDAKFPCPSHDSFNPTDYDCELLESGE